MTSYSGPTEFPENGVVELGINQSDTVKKNKNVFNVEHYIDIGDEQVDPRDRNISSYILFLDKHKSWILAFLLVLLLGLGYVGKGIFEAVSYEGFWSPHAKSTKFLKEISGYGNLTAPSGLLILTEHPTWKVNDVRYVKAYNDLKTKLVGAKYGCVNFVSFFEYKYLTKMVSTDRTKAIIKAELSERTVFWWKHALKAPPLTSSDFSEAAADSPLKVAFAGDYLNHLEINDAISKGLRNIELNGVPVLVILLIFSFGGVFSAIVPLALIIWTIVLTFFCLRLVAFGFKISNYSTSVATIFGTGLAIDFSLFLHLRFLEEWSRAKNKLSFDGDPILFAVDRMIHTTGKTVVFSALVLCTTLCGILQFSEYYLTSLSLSLMFSAAIAAVGAAILTPILYLLFRDRIVLLSTHPVESAVWSSINYFYEVLTTRLAMDCIRKYAKVHTAKSVSVSISSCKDELNKPISNNNDRSHSYEKNDNYNNINGNINAIDNDNTINDNHNIKNNRITIINNYNRNDHNELADLKAIESVSSIVSEELENIHKFNSLPHDVALKEFNGATKSKFLEKADYITEEDAMAQETLIFRIVDFTMTHPWKFFLLISGCFLALFAVFVFDARFAQQGVGNFPLQSENRYVYSTMSQSFKGSDVKSASIQIFLRTRAAHGIRSPKFLDELESFCSDILLKPKAESTFSIINIDRSKNLSDYKSIYSSPFSPKHLAFTAPLMKPFYLTDFDRVTVASVNFDVLLSDPALRATVEGVRESVKLHFTSDVVEVAEAIGLEVMTVDLLDEMRVKIPKVVAIIVVFMFASVMLMTNSVVLPIKAILCGLLSMGACFGFLVLTIQNNYGREIFQFKNDLQCLDPMQMMFIFVVSFGLSIDYEIFILGRIQEVYRRTGDSHFSVCRGVQTCSSALTKAALLMFTVIAGFIASEVLLMKQIGLGVGLAVLIDASVIRLFYLPSFMALMGKWNWVHPPSLIKVLIDKFGCSH